MTGSVVDIACELLRKRSSVNESELAEFRHEFSEAVFARAQERSRLLEDELEAMHHAIEELYSLLHRQWNRASDDNKTSRWLRSDA